MYNIDRERYTLEVPILVSNDGIKWHAEYCMCYNFSFNMFYAYNKCDDSDNPYISITDLKRKQDQRSFL